jgi:hypothetical protein
VTSKITLTVAAFLFTLSSIAVAGTANATPRLTAVRSRQALNWAAPQSAYALSAHRYHGGPKSNY